MSIPAIILAWILGLAGAFEVGANGYLLVSGTSNTQGRALHGDLPRSASDKEARGKVILMLGLGVGMLACIGALIVTQNVLWMIAAATLLTAMAAFDLVRHPWQRTVIPLVASAVLLVLTVLATR